MRYAIAVLVGLARAQDDCEDDWTVSDSFGDDCSWYYEYPSGCGSYDSDVFVAGDACCACSGSYAYLTYDDGCTDGGGVDSFGDSCLWYDDWPSGCGNYDTADWSAYDACCACGGGDGGSGEIWDQSGCWEWQTEGDIAGDGCDWYTANPGNCNGSWDTETFYATDCCICGGGVWEDDLEVADDTGDDSLCEEWQTTADSGGDGCGWYAESLWCDGTWDTEDFSAADCCGCGGGDSVSYDDIVTEENVADVTVEYYAEEAVAE